MFGNKFWTDTDFEPKRNSRFQVQLLSSDYVLSVPHYLISNAQKPSFIVENKSYRFINEAHNYPGVVTWNSVDITFIDTNKNDVLSVINKFLMDGFLNISQDEADFSTDITSRNNAIEKKTYALSQVVMYALDAEGDEVETWFLDKAWIKEVKFSSLDYSNEDLATMTITLVYDWATLTFASREKIDNNGEVSQGTNNESAAVKEVKQKEQALAIATASPFVPSAPRMTTPKPDPNIILEYSTHHGLEYSTLRYKDNPTVGYTMQTGFLADGKTRAQPTMTAGSSGNGSIFGRMTWFTNKPKK